MCTGCPFWGWKAPSVKLESCLRQLRLPIKRARCSSDSVLRLDPAHLTRENMSDRAASRCLKGADANFRQMLVNPVWHLLSGILKWASAMSVYCLMYDLATECHLNVEN